MVKNFNDVSGNYICARYALSHYIFALVLEYVVAGLIDNESMEALKDKIEETFEKFNQTTEGFRGQLSLIQNNNAQMQQSIWQSPFYGWYYDGSAHYHPNQQNEFNRLNNENAHIEYISNNVLSYFDIKRDRETLFNLIEAPGTIPSKYCYYPRREIERSMYIFFSQVLCIRLALHRAMNNLRDGLSQIQSDFTLIETNHPTLDAIAFF